MSRTSLNRLIDGPRHVEIIAVWLISIALGLTFWVCVIMMIGDAFFQ